MKITCNFCKTEYELKKAPKGMVKCAVCGHTWLPHKPVWQNTLLKFIAALCALIAACVFAFAVMITYKEKKAVETKPVYVDQASIQSVVQDNHVVVSGYIVNNSEDLQGLPKVIITSFGENDVVLTNQKFLPPVTLVEPKTTVSFNYTLSVNPVDVKRVAIELKE